MKLPPGSKYFLLAGVVGLAAVFLVHRFITSTVRIPIIPSAQLVVAEVDIAPGTALDGRVLRVAAPTLTPPVAVREGSSAPEILHADAMTLGNEVARYDQAERTLGRRPFEEPVFPPVRAYDPLLQLADQEVLWGPQGTPDRPGLHPMWLDDLIIRPAIPADLGEMGRLAHDGQNVHTRVVNEVVNTSLDLLLDVRDPINGFDGFWSNFPVTKENRSMHRDMKKWYDTESCRSDEDWLYRKTLDGLWTLIDRSPFRDELMVRLTQEADESVGMCCDGHIARLCNVMVGFDDAFKAPVSVTEVLGARMSAIAEMDLSVEAKVVEAWAAFEELHIDHAARKDWVSAF
jgi:hypothetical protein